MPANSLWHSIGVKLWFSGWIQPKELGGFVSVSATGGFACAAGGWYGEMVTVAAMLEAPAHLEPELGYFDLPLEEVANN